jgi:hypothetical protein
MADRVLYIGPLTFGSPLALDASATVCHDIIEVLGAVAPQISRMFCQPGSGLGVTVLENVRIGGYVVSLRLVMPCFPAGGA